MKKSSHQLLIRENFKHAEGLKIDGFFLEKALGVQDEDLSLTHQKSFQTAVCGSTHLSSHGSYKEIGG